MEEIILSSSLPEVLDANMEIQPSLEMEGPSNEIKDDQLTFGPEVELSQEGNMNVPDCDVPSEPEISSSHGALETVPNSTYLGVSYTFQDFSMVAQFSHPSRKYFIGCKWSPDGTCLLANCADYSMRIFNLPQKFYSQERAAMQKDEAPEILEPALEMREGGLVYDYDWYPFMSSWSPPTCCFITTSAGSPVHLWDAYTGKIRASYRAYDYADEVHAAISLTFSSSGEDIYCGFRDMVKIFDVSKPGRECEIFKLKELSGQKGIVSCITENPNVPELFAVGTFSKSIGLYTRSREFVSELTGQKSGLTQLKFSSDGSKLFSGARMHGEILCWDVRNLGSVLFSIDRTVKTNQRIYFDLTRDEAYFMSGGTDGRVSIWELPNESLSEAQLKTTFQASVDCVNGASFNNSYPVIATASGQLRRPEIGSDDDDIMFYDDGQKMDTSVRMWWAGGTSLDQKSTDLEME